MRASIERVLTLALAAALAAPVAAERATIPLPHAEGVSLAAVLELPEGAAPSHALLLLPPAGPADPDLSLGPRGIFKAVAERLALEGVASLRLSSRGVAPATGDWLQTSFEDRVADAVAAFAWLRKRPGFANVQIAVGGLSEGGAIALAVARERSEVVGVVVLSTPMEEGLPTMRWQRDRLLAASALAPAQKELVTAESDRLLAGVLAADKATVRGVLAGPAGMLVLPPYGMVPRDLEGRVDFVLSTWYRSQVGYRASHLVEATRVPVFAAYGELDQVIDGPEAASLLSSGLPPELAVDIRTLPQRNHLMMPAVTGSPQEYAQLPEVVDTDLWSAVAEWVRGLGSSD